MYARWKNAFVLMQTMHFEMQLLVVEKRKSSLVVLDGCYI